MRWPETQLRYLSQVPITNGLGEAGDKGNPIDWPRYIRTTDINDLLTLHEDRRVTLPIAKAEAALVKKDDILMTAAGATVGKSFQYCQAEPACYAGYLVRWRPDTKFAFPRFMAYWTDSKHFYDQIATGTVKSTIENFSASKYRSMRAPMPSLDEQETIADYLDRETQKIDELITEQRGLIETLRERRRVVIDDVFFRRAADSRRLRRLLTSSITGPFGTQLKSSEYVNDCVPVINPTHIVNSRICPDWLITVTSEKSVELERFRLIPGDVILGRKGDVDKAAVVSNVEEGYICGSDSMALRPSEELNGEYLWWYLQSPSAHRQLEQWSVGSTVAGLNQRTISHLEIPIMGLSFQLEVCAYLNTQTSRIDELIAESEDLIALSQERRAALITAAVTGQIDVREAS